MKKAWSIIVSSLLPNIKALEKNLDKFSELLESDEIVLFEKATFLVIAQSIRKQHKDIHRFEKISNIIKQFKLSCSKAQSQFQSMEIRHQSFSLFFEPLTQNSFLMILLSDTTIRKNILIDSNSCNSNEYTIGQKTF